MKNINLNKKQIISILGIFLFLLLKTASIQGTLTIPEGWRPIETKLAVTDKLKTEEKELIIDTDEWKVVMSLFYNGGIYKMFDKVHDPNMQDNLVMEPEYSQGGIFDYDVYLQGDQEFMTTLGRNSDPCRATLEILENTPVRLRVRQKCHPRLNNGDGPPEDIFLELDKVETTTEWTFYPTGRINIKFDAVTDEDWNKIISQGPGGTGKGINSKGNTITSANGTDFLHPWITQGDMIESTSGGWGPVQVAERIDKDTLILETEVASGTNLDFIIRRTNILDETFSIHADGDMGPTPHTSYWQGGSNGDILYDNGTDGDFFRNGTPPVEDDYVYALWTRLPRGFGSLLAFFEPFTGASYAVFNDLTWNVSYTQVARRGWRRFEEHHRHFMAQMGTENGKILPRIKSVADSLPFADDYRHPYAEARIGTLLTGDGISAYGYHVSTGAYHIKADQNKTAAIAFDTSRGGTVESPLAYFQPAILVSDFDIIDDNLLVELSQDNGNTYEELPNAWYNITTFDKSSQLGTTSRRLIQLFCPIPSIATAENAWILRLSEK